MNAVVPPALQRLEQPGSRASGREPVLGDPRCPPLLTCDHRCLRCGPRAGHARNDEPTTDEALRLVAQLAEAGVGEVALGRHIGRLERPQNETNVRLGRIEDTLATSSRLFELMHARLESLEEGQAALVEGRKLVIDRLDRLVEASARNRTGLVERVAVVERRTDQLEQRVDRAP